MKKTFFLLFVMAISLFSTAIISQETKLSTAKFSVKKMTCATCPIAVSKAMKRVEGVIDVEVSLENKLAVVTYDSEITNSEAIGDASTNIGFPATLINDEN